MKPGMSLLLSAQTWIGAPWRKDGRDRERGVDCANMIGCAGIEAGLLYALPGARSVPLGFWRHPGDPITESIRDSRAFLVPGLDLVELPWTGFDSLEPGDILTISALRKIDKATHAAVVKEVCGYGCTILHASATAGRVRESALDPGWRVLRIFRVVRWER